MTVARPTYNATELTVGQLSARSGVAVTTLHFYESKGLLTSRRTSGNQRRYTRDALRRISVIRVARTGALADLVGDSPGSSAGRSW